jgi:hypothetical protein
MSSLQDRERQARLLAMLRHPSQKFPQRELERALDLGERELADLIIERHALRLLRESRRPR